MHGDGAETEKPRKKSYIAEKEREETSKVNKVYEKSFHAVYWLLKEEIAMVKFKSILNLLESIGVKDIELFDTRSSHIVRENGHYAVRFAERKASQQYKKGRNIHFTY